MMPEDLSVQYLPGWDAAFMPQPLPPGYAGVYVGGSNAFRIAPDEDLEAVALARALVLPIWVPSPWIDNPRQVAFQAAARLEALGIPRYARPYRALMIDLETWADPTWLDTFAPRFLSQGYETIPYGSAGNIFEQPKRLGWAVADPTGNPHMYPHAGVVITQYAWDKRAANGVLYDGDLAFSWLAKHLGPIGTGWLRNVEVAEARAALDPEDRAEGPEPPPPADAAPRIEAPAATAPPYTPLDVALGPGRAVPPRPLGYPIRDQPQA